MLEEVIKVNKNSYVCVNKIKIPISFELIKKPNSLVHYQKKFNLSKAIEIDDNVFNVDIFISCDYPGIKKVLEVPQIKSIVMQILDEEKVQGIYLRNNELKIKITGYKSEKEKKDIIEYLKNTYHQKMKELAKEIEPLLFDMLKNEKNNIKEFAQKMNNKIEIFYSIYISSFIASLIMLVYIKLIKPFPIIMIDEIPLSISFIIALLLFGAMTSWVWNSTKGSNRVHFLYSPNLIFFLPACWLFTHQMIYVMNYSFDNGTPKFENYSYDTNYRTTSKHSYKSLDLKSLSDNPQLGQKYISVKIPEKIYKELSYNKSNSLNLRINSGFLKYKYFSELKKINTKQ